MASRPRDTDAEPSAAAADNGVVPLEPASITRRAPFSDNPRVGVRGQRTQQRILDAAMRVFAEDGYHTCSIDRIAQVAECSRASFYQYFSGKEDLFLHLSGTVARQLNAATEAIGPLTADLDGWNELRLWIRRYAEIYHRYEPLFVAIRAASESDEAISSGSDRWNERTVATMHSKVVTTPLPPRQLEPVLTLLLECTPRTLEIAAFLRSAAPTAFTDERVQDALTDVQHRALFGVRADVNVHPPAAERPPPLAAGPTVIELFQHDGERDDLTPAGAQTLDALTRCGRDVFVRRGYHGTRVDDITAAAGLSHGAYYRYFKNKHELARSLTSQAIRTLAATMADIPIPTSTEGSASADGASARAALRRWLRRYNTTQENEAAIIRVWFDANLDGSAPTSDAAAVYDWGRRQMARFLQARGFGDVDTEAVVMVALLGSFGARHRDAASTDAAAHIIEQGLLGHDA